MSPPEAEIVVDIEAVRMRQAKDKGLNFISDSYSFADKSEIKFQQGHRVNSLFQDLYRPVKVRSGDPPG